MPAEAKHGVDSPRAGIVGTSEPLYVSTGN